MNQALQEQLEYHASILIQETDYNLKKIEPDQRITLSKAEMEIYAEIEP